MRRAPILLVLALCVSAASAVSAEPLGSAAAVPTPARPFGWRGDGTGRFPGATPPTTWSAEKNVRWSAVVGASYSSPVVTDKLVVVASEPNVLTCLDRAAGKPAWRVEVTPADLPDEAARTGAAAYEPPKNGSGVTAATPVTDGRDVYAVFANGIVRAVALADGKPRWAAYIDAMPSTAYGRAASPLLVGGKLIVHMTGLYAFDAATGKQLWVNAEAKSTYATPAVMTVGGADYVVTPGGDVVGVADGKSVASGIGLTQQASPMVDEGGVIYFASDPVSAVRLGKDFKDEEAWNGAGVGETFGSPLRVGDTLFVVNGEGKLYAFDATGKGSLDALIDGRPLFAKGEREGPISYASPTLAGKYIFVHSTAGETVVLEATREAKEVAKNRLPAGSGGSPVFAGKEMFVRDGERIYCIGE